MTPTSATVTPNYMLSAQEFTTYVTDIWGDWLPAFQNGFLKIRFGKQVKFYIYIYL